MKLIIPILIAMLAFPAILFADTPPPDETPKVTGIQKGEEAPYNGVLLNTAAAAKIFADKEARKRKADMMNNSYLSDNMVAVTDTDAASGSKGNYDANTGIFRPDDKVSTVRKGRYGGALPMMYGGDPFSQYENGGEIVDIDFEMYKELIAAGAEIEIV